MDKQVCFTCCVLFVVWSFYFISWIFHFLLLCLSEWYQKILSHCQPLPNRMLYYDRIIKYNLFHFHFSECISFTHLHLYQSIETNISLTSPKMPRVTTMTLCSITDYSKMDLLLALSFCLFVILKLHGIDKRGFVITIHDTMVKIYRLWNESFTHLLLIWYLNVKQTWKNKSQIHNVIDISIYLLCLV